MMRKTMCRLDATKMPTLHKILTGEVQFKNKAAVKVCNVELMFGAKWQSEFAAYSAKLPAAEKTIADRQVGRLLLTAYTTRELAQFGGNGPAGVAGAAEAQQIADGLALLKQGESAFTAKVQEEGKLANWTDAQVSAFIGKVKAAKA